MIKRLNWISRFAIFAVLVSALTLSCAKKAADSGSKATVEVVNGVKTVRNPETPRYGTFALDLVEDLAIGNENEDAFLFQSRVGIAVDGEGRISVVDFGNRRVQVFDKNGSFVRTLGRVGQGPGEYEFPSGVMVDAGGNVSINDAARALISFSPDGLFQKRVALTTSLSLLTLGPAGTIIGETPPSYRDEGGPKYKLVQFGPDGEMLRTLAEFRAYGASPGMMLRHWYSGAPLYCLRSEDSLFYGYSLDDRIHVVDREGREIFSFTKAEKSLGITDEEADLTRKEGIFVSWGQGDRKTAPLDLPDHRPYFSRFLSDDLGRLFVVRSKPITEKDVKTSDIDVFSKDGNYLYRMTWPFVPQVIKGGFLYEVRQDEEAGLTKIIRHRIKNWGDFRAE